MLDLKFIELDFNDTNLLRKKIKQLFRKHRLDADAAVDQLLCDKFFIQAKMEAVQNDERTEVVNLYIKTLFLERLKKIYRAARGQVVQPPRAAQSNHQQKYIFLMFLLVALVATCLPSKKIFVGGSTPRLDVESDFDFMAG